jgi:hypothetical protein
MMGIFEWPVLAGLGILLCGGLLVWRVRARAARWNAIVDAYAEREINSTQYRRHERANQPYSRRNTHARTQSQTW